MEDNIIKIICTTALGITVGSSPRPPGLAPTGLWTHFECKEEVELLKIAEELNGDEESDEREYYRNEIWVFGVGAGNVIGVGNLRPTLNSY